MIKTELEIAKLLPIDEEVSWHGVSDYLEALEKGKSLDPIRTLPFPEDDSEEYIVLDGHHRARATHEFGLTVIEAAVFTTDEDLGEFVRDERGWWRPNETQEAIRRKYRTYWSGKIAHLGITSIADIPEVIHQQRSWKREHDYESIPVDRQGNRLG